MRKHTMRDVWTEHLPNTTNSKVIGSTTTLKLHVQASSRLPQRGSHNDVVRAQIFLSKKFKVSKIITLDYLDFAM